MQQLNQDTTYAELTKQRFKAPSAEVREALSCAPIVKDSTSRVTKFFESIFNGQEQKFVKKVYLDDNGAIIRTEEEPVISDEALEETEEVEEENTSGGFFSFLKRKKKNDEEN